MKRFYAPFAWLILIAAAFSLGYMVGSESVWKQIAKHEKYVSSYSDSLFAIGDNVVFDSITIQYISDSIVDETGLKSHSFFKDEIARKDEIIRFNDSVIKSQKSKKFFQ